MALTTFSGPVRSLNGFISGHQVSTANAINATATATAAQVASGYITSTSAAAIFTLVGWGVIALKGK